MKEIPLDLSRRRMGVFPMQEIPLQTAWLVLSNNQISRVPDEIKRLQMIERLALNDNSISEVEEGFGQLSKLTWVDMTRNNLKGLPSNLYFNKLVGLGLSENDFEEIPQCVFNFKSLKKFGFFSNRIKFISPKIENLRNLVKLDLSNNLIEELPDEICCLNNLSWLNLSNNKLKKLPSNFGMLVNLEELGLGNNSLEEIPDMSNIKRLRIFSAFNNKIKSFDIKSSSIRKIDLSNNQIKKFPECLLKIRNLHTLSLKNNLVQEISTRKIVSSNIRSIDLRFNMLNSIPLKFLKSIENCQVLLLEGNKFSIRKDSFPQIPSLHNICMNNYINSPRKIDRKVENRNSICDSCCRIFVSKSIKMYFLASLDPGEKFCLEEEVCSNKCYLNSIEMKSSGDAFCNLI